MAGANLVSLADALAFDPPLIGEEATKFVLTIGPVLCAIHPSSWNKNSPKLNSRSTEFSEVHMAPVLC